jgi:hypothetical protein
MVREGLKALGASAGNAALAALPKSDERKIVLACLLRERTSVSNDWIASRLAMGHPGSAAGEGGRRAVRLEAQQNRADVEMGLKTLSDHFQELGADFGEEIERRASDAKLILETAAKHGVPVEMLWKPS